MTAQVNDTFHYMGKDYTLAEIHGSRLFHPADVGLEPQGACTACWRGYTASFAVVDSHLVLDRLWVSINRDGSNGTGPAIDGVNPTNMDGELSFLGFNNCYEGLNRRLRYTGWLLITDGFISDLYSHMGFHPAWKYERGYNLTFKDGRLIRAMDCSEALECRRRAEIESLDADKGQGSAVARILRAFSRDHRR